MNVERIKMLHTMMGRIIAKSWIPTPAIMGGEVTPDGCNMVDKPVAVNNFDLGQWRGMDYEHKDPNICGFTACAVGHMCFDPEFRKLGWFWGFTGGFGFPRPSFKGNTEWKSIRLFFDIDIGLDEDDYGIGELLFLGESYVEYHNNMIVSMLGPEDQLVFDRISDLLDIGEDAFLKKYADILSHLRTQ